MDDPLWKILYLMVLGTQVFLLVDAIANSRWGWAAGFVVLIIIVLWRLYPIMRNSEADE